MEILMFVVFSAIGFVVSCFGIMQILLVVFVSFPLVKIIARQKGLINPGHVINKSIITILIWTLIVGTVTFFIFAYASTASIIGYAAGIIYALLLGIKRLKINEDNTRDFVNSHKDDIDWVAYKKSLNKANNEEANFEEISEIIINEAIEADYESIFRCPDNYAFAPVFFSGRVFSCSLTEGSPAYFLVGVFQDDDINKCWFVLQSRHEGDSQLVEGDHVKVYAGVDGAETNINGAISSRYIRSHAYMIETG